MCVCSVRTFSNHLRGVTFGKLRRDQKRKNPSDSQKEPNVATAIDFFLGFPSGSIRISGDPETGPNLKQIKKKRCQAVWSGDACLGLPNNKLLQFGIPIHNESRQFVVITPPPKPSLISTIPFGSFSFRIQTAISHVQLAIDGAHAQTAGIRRSGTEPCHGGDAGR